MISPGCAHNISRKPSDEIELTQAASTSSDAARADLSCLACRRSFGYEFRRVVEDQSNWESSRMLENCDVEFRHIGADSSNRHAANRPCFACRLDSSYSGFATHGPGTRGGFFEPFSSDVCAICHFGEPSNAF